MRAPTCLADTNILGDLSRPRPNPGVLAWAGRTHAIAISVVTIEEALYGISRHPVPRARAWFDDFLGRYCQILDVTAAIALQAGTLRGQLAARGRIRTQADMLIAATAAHHGLTMVTRNVRAFEECGVSVLNPFS